MPGRTAKRNRAAAATQKSKEKARTGVKFIRKEEGEVDRRGCVKTSEGDAWDLPIDLDSMWTTVHQFRNEKANPLLRVGSRSRRAIDHIANFAKLSNGAPGERQDARNLLVEICLGYYGESAEARYQDAKERLRASFMRVHRCAAEADTRIDLNKWWNASARFIDERCAASRRQLAQREAINGDMQSCRVYIERRKRYSAKEISVEHHFAVMRLQDVHDIEAKLRADAGVDLTQPERAALRREVEVTVFGFATASKESRVLQEIRALLETDEAKTRFDNDIAPAVRACVSNARTELNTLHRLRCVVDVASVGVSRLESIATTWLHELSRKFDIITDANNARLSMAWMDGRAEDVIYAVLRLVANQFVYGGQQAAAMKNRDRATISCAFMSDVPRTSRATTSPAMRNRSDDFATFAEAVEAEIQKLKTERSEEFAIYMQQNFERQFGDLRVAFAIAGTDYAAGSQAWQTRIFTSETGNVLHTSAKRLWTNTSTQMRIHFRTRFRSLVRAELGRLQLPEAYAGFPTSVDANAYAQSVRAFCVGSRKRRERLVGWLCFKFLYKNSPLLQASETWTKRVKPKPALAKSLAECNLDNKFLYTLVEQRIHDIIPTDQNVWTKLMECYAYRGGFDEADVRLPFSSLGLVTMTAKARTEAINRELVAAFGPSTVYSSPWLEVGALNRFCFERGIEYFWIEAKKNTVEILRTVESISTEQRRYVLRALRRVLGDRLSVVVHPTTQEPIPAPNVTIFEAAIGILQEWKEPIVVPADDDTSSTALTCSERQRKKIASLFEHAARMAETDNGRRIDDSMNMCFATACDYYADLDRVVSNVQHARDSWLDEADIWVGADQPAQGAPDTAASLRERKLAKLGRKQTRELRKACNAVVRSHLTRFILNGANRTGASAPSAPSAPSALPAPPQQSLAAAAPPAAAAVATVATPGPDGSSDNRVRYWNPPRMSGKCAAVSVRSLNLNECNWTNGNLAALAGLPCVAPVESLPWPSYGPRAGVNARAKDGEYAVASLINPRISRLVRVSHPEYLKLRKHSGSINVRRGTLTANHTWRERRVASDGEGHAQQQATATSARITNNNTVFIGFDPGRNWVISSGEIYPTRTRGRFKFMGNGISSRSIHSATRPMHRARQNAQRRARALADPARGYSSNAIALSKATYTVMRGKFTAFGKQASVYVGRAASFMRGVVDTWRQQAGRPETEKPNIIISCGNQGVAVGRRWGGSRMKGAPNTSASRLVDCLSDAGRRAANSFDLTVVDEHGTSQACPSCNTRLQAFHPGKWLFPVLGNRVNKPNSRNGRVCGNPECEIFGAPENRDTIGGLNMLRKLYAQLEDACQSDADSARLLALANAFRGVAVVEYRLSLDRADAAGDKRAEETCEELLESDGEDDSDEEEAARALTVIARHFNVAITPQAMYTVYEADSPHAALAESTNGSASNGNGTPDRNQVVRRRLNFNGAANSTNGSTQERLEMLYRLARANR
jgi:hypothetical protein